MDAPLRSDDPPRVAMVMTTYRHAQFVDEALAAALAQTWPALDVVVSDDGSDDGTWDLVCARAAAYRGPHRLILVRQGSNVGAARNLLGALERTAADFLVLAHGDDVSHPDRVRRAAETWIETGASLVTSQARTGEDPDHAELLADDTERSGPISLEELSRHSWTPRWLGASFAFERRVFTEFGPFDRARLPRGGDHVIPTRAALLGGVHYLAEPLVFWRRHGRQMTLHTADFDGDEHSHAETWHAYDLNALVYRYEEVEAFEQRHSETDATRAARANLLETIADLAERWAERRSKLQAKGLRLRFEPRRAACAEAAA